MKLYQKNKTKQPKQAWWHTAHTKPMKNATPSPRPQWEKIKGTQHDVVTTLPSAIQAPGVCIYQEDSWCSPRLKLSTFPMNWRYLVKLPSVYPSVCLATCPSRPGPVSHLWSIASVAALDTLSQFGIPPAALQPRLLIYTHLQWLSSQFCLSLVRPLNFKASLIIFSHCICYTSLCEM